MTLNIEVSTFIPNVEKERILDNTDWVKKEIADDEYETNNEHTDY